MFGDVLRLRLYNLATGLALENPKTPREQQQMDTSIANGVALLSVAMLLWAVVHTLTAGQRAKQLAEQWLGKKLSDRVYRLAYNIFSGVIFLPIIVLLGLLPDYELYMLPPLVMVLTVPL